MSVRGPYRRHSLQFKIQVCSDIRSGKVGGREALVGLIDDIHDEFPGYGYRRVTLELKAQGRIVNHKRVARIMKAHDLHAHRRHHFKPAIGSEADLCVSPNLYRKNIPTEPDRVWVADITYIRIAAGFVSGVILDACSCKVIGYALSQQIDMPLAFAALDAAYAARRPAAGTCINHTDRGANMLAGCIVMRRRGLV
jgi:putative transposase